MIARSLLLTLPPLLIGLAVLFLVWPGPLYRQALLKVFLGVGAGLGVDSCLYFAWSMLFHPAQKGFLIVEEIVLVGLLAALFWFRLRHDLPSARINWHFHMPGIPSLLLTALFVGAIALAAVNFVTYTFLQPLGSYDAFGIWNLRARLILTNAANWKIAFSPILYWNIHPDYPLLLTANVTRLWVLLGQLSPRAPIVLSGLFTFSLVGLLFAGVAELKDAGQGAIAGLVLLGTPSLLLLAGSQTAEIPLLYYLLASATLLLLYSRGRQKPLLALAGLMAGLAAWTKNEGSLYLAALCATLVIVTFLTRDRSVDAKPFASRIGETVRSLIPFAIGLLLPLVTLLAFKLTLAPSGDLFTGQNVSGILAKLTDLSRYRTIMVALGQDLWDLGRWGPPILPILLVAGVLLFDGIRREDRWGLQIILLSSAITLLGYLSIYVITPHPLKWHLDNSLDRLLLHFFPVLLMVLFSAGRSIEQALAGITRRQRTEAKEQ